MSIKTNQRRSAALVTLQAADSGKGRIILGSNQGKAQIAAGAGTDGT
jgi:hypothetical protein